MPRPTFQFFCLFLLLFLALITTPIVAQDIPQVQNTETPRDGKQTVALEELWRVGSESDDLIFGRVPRVETDQQGNIYIFDSQLCQVHVFSPAGELLRTVFREGDGPGEARGPKDMILMPDGGIGLVLESLGIVKFVDAAGQPAGSLRLGATEGGNYALMSSAGLDGAVLLTGRRSTAGESRSIRKRRNFLVRSDLDGNETAVYAESQTVWDFSKRDYVERDELPSFQYAFDVTADGRVYSALNRDKYEISVFKPDGTPEFVIQKEYPPFKRSAEDRDRFIHMIETSMEGMPFAIEVKIEETYPAIGILNRGIQVTPDGSLWVLSGRGLKPETPGVMAVFDVFDSNGVFVRQVALAGPHKADQVGIVLAGGNRVIVIEGYLESLASQFGNSASFSGEEWNNPEIIVYSMDSGN